VAYHGFSAMVVTKKTTKSVLLQRNQYFLPKTNDITHELHLRLPPSPIFTYPPGGEGSRGRIPNILPLVVGGEWYGNTPKSTLSSSALSPEKDRVCHPANRYPASPRKMIASAIGQEPYAINIRLPPGKDCIGK
jgi:hypothetical protein